MTKTTPVCFDFETLGIETRPHYPPSPVGVSIKYPGKASRYYAFGHPTENNCTWTEARDALAKAYAWGTERKTRGLLCHNTKFDIDVAATHFGLEVPHWHYLHDTMLLLYMDDPHQRELGLKPSSERLLEMAPDERDAVTEWLVDNQPLHGQDVKISKSRSSEHYAGRYISLAPGDLVGTYANSDTDRTAALFDLLHQKTIDRGMSGAYDRERRLLPILLRMERRGVAVDLARLKVDVDSYSMWLLKIDSWIFARLKLYPNEINLNSGEQLVQAMVTTGAADPDLIPKTKTGKFQSNKEALLVGVIDTTLLAVLKYRTQLRTCLNTFMSPWLITAERSDGLIFTSWNQVKSSEGSGNVGTRTGRLSSTPNFQNIPNIFGGIFWSEETPHLPDCPFNDLPVLPDVRSYILPFKGHVLIDRDISQQELRVLAHFDGGDLLTAYLENPWIDFHNFTQAELAKVGKVYDRKPVKNTGLGLIYGMGVGKLAEKNNMSVDEAGQLKKAILQLYPGLKSMYGDMKIRARSNTPIRTWGGREYYCEPPKIIDGKMREFDYKMVNVLIQGSAADCTKEAIIRLQDLTDEAGMADKWFVILNVHDQITMSVPVKDAARAMEMMRISIESLEFDVPMLSEGTTGYNWSDLKDYDKHGKNLKTGVISKNVAPSVAQYQETHAA